MSALDPVFTVGHQIDETLRIHTASARRGARADHRYAAPGRHRVAGTAHRRISASALRRMRQRVMIAAALICGPQAPDRRRADHRARRHRAGADPRTAARLSETSNTALMLITHDLGVIAETCSRVVTMYAGEVSRIPRSSRAGFGRCIPIRPACCARFRGSAREVGGCRRSPGGFPRLPACRMDAASSRAVGRHEAARPQELLVAGKGRKVRCWRLGELELPGALKHAPVGADRGKGRQAMMRQAGDSRKA